VALATVLTAVWVANRTRGSKAVFLIVVDTLRPDRLSYYGHRAHNTTNIDGLASSGVTFRNAQSPASWTVPSMGSMMTSLYPSQLGLVETPNTSNEWLKWRDRRSQCAFAVPREATTLPAILSTEGFHTAAFVNQPALNVLDGFVLGFDEWFFPDGSSEVQQAHAKPVAANDEVGERAGPNTWKQQAQADAQLVTAFVEWLESHSRGRIFVWLHVLSPHAPYDPPRPYRGAGAEGRRPSTLYDAEVRYIDDLMKNVLDAISEQIGFERSIIVFTSDHGEEFGEHGMFEHGHSLHREVMWVPLIFAGAGLPSGILVDAHVSTIDIMPTVLDLVGVPVPTPRAMVGTSLLPLITDGSLGRTLYSEGVLYGSSERALIENGFKLMYDDQQPELRLFDAERDHRERTDLADRHPERVAEMSSRLNDIHHAAVDYQAARFPIMPDSLVSAEERERIERALRALGYIND
jgi:arylsulfatase A-like enzyme